MGQKMKNAPIYYSIVQVRFNAVLSIERHVPQIQDKLRRAGFPDYERVQLGAVIPGISIEAAPALQQTVRHDFRSLDRSAGVMLEHNTLSFHTTKYETVEPFVESFLRALKTVDDEVGHLSYWERLGMRTLDAICPAPGESMADYLRLAVLGVSSSFPDRTLLHSISETRTQSNGSTLMSRAVIMHHENEAPAAFPPELATVNLVQAQKFQRIRGCYAVVDSDCWLDTREEFSFETIKEKLGFLHTELRRSFDATVTPEALKRWA